MNLTKFILIIIKMSSNHTQEYNGLKQSRANYTNLSNIWTYSCPYKNKDYPGFANGLNCLCQKDLHRSSGDIAVIYNKKWPVSNDRLGWK